MSNSFVNSQLFSNSERKESYLKNEIHNFSYYSSVLEGKITWTEWKDLSPRERDIAIESLDEIRKIKRDALKANLPNQNN